MAKTQEELNILKKEVKAVNEKLAELNEEELEQVIGGVHPGFSHTFTFGKLFDLNDIASNHVKNKEDDTLYHSAPSSYND